MTPQAPTAQENLAFLRALVDQPARADVAGGKFFLVTGLIWAFDAFVLWFKYAGLLPMSAAQEIAFVGAVTVVWIVLATLLRWGGPKRGAAPPVGAAARALGTASIAVGAMMVLTLVVFVVTALRSEFLGAAIFRVYPSMMFAGFGALWFAAFMIWRRLWLLGVALGWFAAAVAYVAVDDVPATIALAGLSMLLLLALPGAMLMREGRKEEAA